MLLVQHGKRSIYFTFWVTCQGPEYKMQLGVKCVNGQLGLKKLGINKMEKCTIDFFDWRNLQITFCGIKNNLEVYS
jgi:hypothetical protein